MAGLDPGKGLSPADLKAAIPWVVPPLLHQGHRAGRGWSWVDDTRRLQCRGMLCFWLGHDLALGAGGVCVCGRWGERRGEARGLLWVCRMDGSNCSEAGGRIWGLLEASAELR